MQFGTIALIDALGFKGIWNDRRGGVSNARTTLRAVKSVLDSERTWAEEHWQSLTAHESVPEFAKSIRFTCHFMSDTAAIAASVPMPEPGEDYPGQRAWSPMVLNATVYVICRALAPAIRAAALAPTPIAYRGAIACGEMDIDDEFTIGPAVDDAASGMEAADGAFVWFMPSALTFCRGMEPHNWYTVWERTTEFDVPLKGKTFRTRVINPLVVQAETYGQIETGRFETALLGTFTSDDVEVAVKRQNTARFLAAARHWVAPPSYAASECRDVLLECLRNSGAERAAMEWAATEARIRRNRRLPIPARFPGTEADAQSFLHSVGITQTSAQELCAAAAVQWLNHPPDVP